MMMLLKHWKLGLGVIGVLVISYAGYQIYKRGFQDCTNNANEQIVNSINKENAGINEVKKNEQSYDISRIDRELCNLGIVRQSVGCFE